MLDRVEGWGPGPVESHHHEHQALGVERSPAEEKSKDNNDWEHCIALDFLHNNSLT